VKKLVYFSGKMKKVDKTGWGPGPWHDEDDLYDWQDPVTGLRCMIVRHPVLGHLCGYVGLPADHPFYGKAYSQCLLGCGDYSYCDHTMGAMVRVHGGVTFADWITRADWMDDFADWADNMPPTGLWWVGFDTGHSNDSPPAFVALTGWKQEGHYRDVAYVKAEVAELALQLAAFNPNHEVMEALDDFIP
jgi:hypothetical protein